MKQSLSNQPSATIYQYKVVKRVPIKNEIIASYLLSILLVLAFQAYYYDTYGIFAWLISFAAVQILHFIIIVVTFIQIDEAADRQWKWTIFPPWIGYRPANDINYRVFRKVHNHVFWLGIILISILYPWLNASIMISLITWHIWLVVPRFLLSMRFKKHFKKTKAGIIRIIKNEVQFLQP